MKTFDANTKGARWRRAALPVLAVASLSACNFDVANPGPTPDALLDSLNAHQAIVAGNQRNLSFAMEEIGYWGAAMVFEINPAGSTGSFGIPSYIQAGRFSDGDTQDWNFVSQARWTAENAVDRFETVLPQIEGAPPATSYGPIAEAALWAGYANRMLGENFCQVVFDSGAPEAPTSAYARAETWFTQANQVAVANGDLDDVAMAAIAGRASVRALLARYGMAQWSDAVADASQVPDDFVWELPFSDQDQDQFNYLYFSNGNQPYRAHTNWATWYQDYYTNTQDPRTPWTVGPCSNCPDPNNPTGDAAVQKFGGLVPWYPQRKFDARESGINLSSGWEMRLIEAEAQLAGGNADAAVAIMQNRVDDLNAAGATIPPLTDDCANASACTVDEGYTILKEQRMYELWLEARRMGDIRSWIENGTPGAFMDGVWQDMDGNAANGNETRTEDLSTRQRAYPIGQSERQVNPDVPSAAVFCEPS
jgi:starch-binding outer membrane protein, SusD/RagB family